MQVILTRAEKRRLQKVIRVIKNAVKVTVVAGLLVAVITVCGKAETEYKVDAKIVQSTYGIYTAQDVAGYKWIFSADEEYKVDTAVELKMHTAGTDSTRTDDTIIEVKTK